MIHPMLQPPPDREPPHSEEDARHYRAKAGMIWWLGGISVAFCLLYSAWPSIRRAHIGKRAVPRSEAINNVKNISMALFEFDNEYGRFPDASTAAAVKAETKTPLTLGSTSSNQLFRQLLVSVAKSEKPFWARTATNRRKPDEVFNTDASALTPGECGFGYVAGLTAGGDGNTPVVMTPLIPGKLLFDPKPYNGMAIILCLDNSATPMPIDKHGRVMVGGMDIFDPRQPFWKGKAPDVKWPE